MAARKAKRKSATKRPAQSGRSRSQQPKKRKQTSGRKSNSTTKQQRKTAKHAPAKRAATKRRGDNRRADRNRKVTRKTSGTPARDRKRIRAAVERTTRPKLKRTKQGGLREYQGKRFRETKFGDYKAALKSVGEENQHAYDEAVEALREGLEEGLSKAAITRRRNKVRRLKK